MAPSHLPPNDPVPEQWCSPERIGRLSRELGAATNLLAISGLLAKAVEYWVRLELVGELDPEELPGGEDLARLAQKWRERRGADVLLLTDALLHRKLQVAPGCRRWARRQWGHRLQSLFLERKQELDRASCRLLRVADKHLCQELYHRIKAGETSFEEVARKFGEGPEREQGGLIPLQPMARLPLNLGAVLPRLKEGGLTPPQRLGEQFALVQLVSREPASLDASSEESLLATELENWMAVVVSHLMAQLGSDSRSSVPGS